jgi:hypothetical protein
MLIMSLNTFKYSPSYVPMYAIRFLCRLAYLSVCKQTFKERDFFSLELKFFPTGKNSKENRKAFD